MENHLSDDYDCLYSYAGQSMLFHLVYRNPDWYIRSADDRICCGLFCKKPVSFQYKIRNSHFTQKVFHMCTIYVNFVDTFSMYFRLWTLICLNRMSTCRKKHVRKKDFSRRLLNNKQNCENIRLFFHRLFTDSHDDFHDVRQLVHRFHRTYFYYEVCIYKK